MTGQLMVVTHRGRAYAARSAEELLALCYALRDVDRRDRWMS